MSADESKAVSARDRLVPYVATASDYASRTALVRADTAETVAEAHAAAAVARERKVLRCAFCDAEYPPGTPTTQHEHLTKHVRVCPKHPMREAESALRRERERAEWLREALGDVIRAYEKGDLDRVEISDARAALAAWEAGK